MKKVILGVLLVISAVLMLLSAVGVSLGMISDFSVVGMLICVAVIAWAVKTVADGSWENIPLVLFVGFFFLEDDIARYLGYADTDIANNWIVLLSAVLCTVGLGGIKSAVTNNSLFTGFKNRSETKLGSEAKYIDCNSFSKYHYKVSMGSGELYFQNIESYTGGGKLSIECHMGNMEIYVPNSWRIEADIQTSVGNTEIPQSSGDGPVLEIRGTNKMGNVEIIYT